LTLTSYGFLNNKDYYLATIAFLYLKEDILASRCKKLQLAAFVSFLIERLLYVANAGILKMKIIASMIGVIAAAALLTTTIPSAYAQQIPHTATILGVCGLATVPPAINYGVLAPNAESSDQPLQITNTGNVQATVLTRGTGWSTTSILNAMPVTATHYSLTSGQPYGSKTALTSTDTEVTTLNPLAAKDTFWQLKITLSDPVAVGPITQIVTLTSQC
jgi:hypothetical protein